MKLFSVASSKYFIFSPVDFLRNEVKSFYILVLGVYYLTHNTEKLPQISGWEKKAENEK